MTKLEEFYAQKEAVSKAYVAYKDELERLSKKDDRFEELIDLIKLNINTIALSSIDLISKTPPKQPYQKIVDSFKPNKRISTKKQKSMKIQYSFYTSTIV